MKRIATICARGGSKGVKNKNIRLINGKPLIHYTVEQVIESKMFDSIVVSSDSDSILDIASEYKEVITIKRPDDLASDTAAKMPVVKHAVDQCELMLSVKFDTICDVDCTSPLRKVEDIVNCISLLESHKASNVLTACPARRSPYFNMIEKGPEGKVKLSKQLASKIVRRQDAPECFDMNASIYVWNRETLMSLKSYFLDKTMLYVMPENRSHDIDTEFDFKIVEYILTNNLHNES